MSSSTSAAQLSHKKQPFSSSGQPTHHLSRQRTNLTNLQKIYICIHKQNNKHLDAEDLSLWTKEEFHLPQEPSRQLINNILKNKEKLLALTRREGRLGNKVSTHRCWRMLEKIEEKVALFVDKRVKRYNQPTKNPVIRSYAESVAKEYGRYIHYNFSNRWLQEFYIRHPHLVSAQKRYIDYKADTASSATATSSSSDDDEEDEDKGFFENMNEPFHITKAISTALIQKNMVIYMKKDIDCENQPTFTTTANTQEEKSPHEKNKNEKLIANLEYILKEMTAENEEESHFIDALKKMLYLKLNMENNQCRKEYTLD